eukprot:COSAG01_NODE_43768_length_426_cov_1.137615_1_plen_87_part_10
MVLRCLTMAAAAVVTTAAAAVAIPAAAASVEFPRTVRIAAGSFRMGVGRTPLPFELTTNSYHRCTPRAADPTGCGKLYGDYDEMHNH